MSDKVREAASFTKIGVSFHALEERGYAIQLWNNPVTNTAKVVLSYPGYNSRGLKTWYHLSAVNGTNGLAALFDKVFVALNLYEARMEREHGKEWKNLHKPK